jgi:hypothetical protein
MDHLCSRCSEREEKRLSEMKRKEMEASLSEMLKTQLRLGRPATGNLTLIAPLPEDVSSSKEVVDHVPQDRLPTGEAFIFRMADELISEILTLVAIRPQYEWPRNYYGRILPLVAVCRRFNRISTPLLYHTAFFEKSCSIVPPCLPARKFHRTMHENAILRPYVKAVRFYCDGLHHIRSLEQYDIANDFMTWFANVSSFKLHSGFANGKQKYIRSMIAKGMKHMPVIRDIALQGEYSDGFLICDVIENFNTPSLRKLHVHGMSDHSHPENDANHELKTSHHGEKPTKVSCPLF